MTPVLRQAMQRAIAAYMRNAWSEAELLCRQVLAAKADVFDALSMLGAIAAQTQRPQEAAEFLGRAAAAKPGDPAAQSNYGNALQQLGRFDEALASYDRALKIKPDSAEAYNNRGSALQGLKRLDDALASYNRAVAIRPQYAEAFYNRGNALQELERLEEALKSYDQALAIKPNYAEAHYNRGNTLHKLKRFQEALASSDRALSIKPDYAEAHNNRGVTLQQLKRLHEALESYDRALTIKPDYAEAFNNRGNALHESSRKEEALASYARALEIKPDYAEAWLNRGNALLELKRLEEALASYDRALALKPDFAEAHYNRGNALLDLRELEEALASYDRALALKADYAEAHYNRGVTLQELRRYSDTVQCFTRLLELAPDFGFAKGNLLAAKMLCCDWTNLGDLCESIRQGVRSRKQATAPFEYQGISDSEQDLQTCAEIYAAERFPRAAIQVGPKEIKRHDKIRIGYLSGEFRHQATSVLMSELFELHAKDRFEIVAFDNGWDDGSAIRARIKAAFDEIVDITRMPDLEAASLIEAKGIDVLVNLNGYFGEARQGIFSHKPSPVQVNYLGFPGTIGADYIDYLIADDTVIPESSRPYYSEKIAYLPNCYQANDRKRPIADKTFSREELGLPREGFVYCCFNNNYKITPATFDGWMRILERVDGSVLWLLEDNPHAARNLRKEAGARGVDEKRLVFAKREVPPEHLARHRAADLFLDTLPYNAHTTASDALWAGLPVLTCTGRTFPGRVAASLLKAVGLPELVTPTQEHYEALAVELATHPPQLEQVRQKLWRNRLTTPLFDARLFTKHIEEAYRQMIERHRAGLPPDHIRVLS